MNPPPIKLQPSPPPFRWWPGAVILALAGAATAFIWLRDAAHTQDKVVNTFPVAFFTLLALFLWMVLFSRLPGRARLAIFLATAVLGVAAVFSLEIKGVSGNIVPVIGFKWSGDRTFDSAGAGSPTSGGAATGVTAPGPGDDPQFYGPGRDATLAGPRLARDWDAQPPRELWRREVGEAWSAFAVVGNAAVTQEQRGEDETVVRYQLTTGEPPRLLCYDLRGS